MDKPLLRKNLKETIKLAKEAANKGNYPIGAVLTNKKGFIIAKTANSTFTDKNPAAHAEMNLLERFGNKLLDDKLEHILFTSLEPCFGCSFFLRYTNIRTIVWALSDSYKGGFSDLKNFAKTKNDFVEFEIIEEPFGDLQQNSKQLLYEFLKSKGKTRSTKVFKN